MLFTMRVLDHQRERIPAVMHVDGTTRPQVVHPESEPEYHSMIAAFHRLTNIPMVLNTSFNRRGEPIVATPEDALAAFWELRCDALAIGPYLVDHPAPLRLDVPRTALAPLQRPQTKPPQARRWVLYSSDEATNDRFSGSVGSFRRVLNEARREPGRLSPRTLHTPIVHGDLSDLARLVLIAQQFDVTLVLAYPEPARTHHGLAGDGWVPLKTAVRVVSACVSLASKRNVDVRVEGFPLCLLGPGIRPLQGPVDTPHMKVPPKRCGACSALAECPTLWPGHHEAFGAAELTPVASD
jgi:hypothetical protein